MELGILILIILGSFIFKKGKTTAEEEGKPLPSKDMTWEEMEEYYGITLSRDSKESEKMKSHINTRNTSESVGDTYDPMDAEPYKVPTIAEAYDESATTIYRGTYESTEECQRTSVKPHIEEVRNVVSTHRSASRKESLRSAARHGMVWSMILEASKATKIMRR